MLSEQLDMDVLPKDAVIIQFMDADSAPPAAPMLTASDIAELIVKGQVMPQPSVVQGVPELDPCVYFCIAALLRCRYSDRCNDCHAPKLT